MQAKKTKAELQDKDLLRYNRNIVLPEIDIDGQLSLLKSKVAVIGLGGIGCPAATYLASSGVGHLCLIDFDHVSLSNLNRQVLFSEDDISEKKAEAAKKNLQSLNSEIDIKSIPRKIDNKFDKDLLKDYDYIIDCTDNFQTRSEINNISIANKIPLISGAAIKMQGQIATFRNDLDGTMLATECIKLICDIGDNFGSKLMLIDMKNYEFKTITINKDHECKFCD